MAPLRGHKRKLANKNLQVKTQEGFIKFMVLAEVNAILIGLWGGVFVGCLMAFMIIVPILCCCGCICLCGAVIGSSKPLEQIKEKKKIKEIKED